MTEERFYTWELLLEDGKRWHTADYLTQATLAGYIDRGVLIRVTVQADIGERTWEDTGAWTVNASKVCAFRPETECTERPVPISGR